MSSEAAGLSYMMYFFNNVLEACALATWAARPQEARSGAPLWS